MALHVYPCVKVALRIKDSHLIATFAHKCTYDSINSSDQQFCQVLIELLIEWTIVLLMYVYHCANVVLRIKHRQFIAT